MLSVTTEATQHLSALHIHSHVNALDGVHGQHINPTMPKVNRPTCQPKGVQPTPIILLYEVNSIKRFCTIGKLI